MIRIEQDMLFDLTHAALAAGADLRAAGEERVAKQQFSKAESYQGIILKRYAKTALQLVAEAYTSLLRDKNLEAALKHFHKGIQLPGSPYIKGVITISMVEISVSAVRGGSLNEEQRLGTLKMALSWFKFTGGCSVLEGRRFRIFRSLIVEAPWRSKWEVFSVYFLGTIRTLRSIFK